MEKLTLRQQLFYGMGGFSVVLPDLIFMQWMVYRYIPAEHTAWRAPAALFGAMVLLCRFSEGIICPLVGHFSDGLRHRWGRRLPFIRYAMVSLLAAFALIYFPPIKGNHWLNLLYAFVVIEIYMISYNSVATPYLSLLPELASSTPERVNLATFQAVFILIGFFAFSFMGMVLKEFGWGVAVGAATMLILLFLLPVAFGIREKPRPEPAETTHMGLFHSIRLVFANKPFRFLVASTALYYFMINGTILTLPYWAKCIAGRDEGAVTWFMLPYLGGNLVFFFVFNLLSKRFGKYVMMLAMYLSTFATIGSFVAIGRLPFGTPFLQTVVAMGLVGCATAGFMVLPFAVLGDVVDYDEQRTGMRREAIFFGLQAVVQKAMTGLSVLTATVLMYWGGANEPTPFGLRLYVGVCALACLGAFFIFLGYPLREKNTETAACMQ